MTFSEKSAKPPKFSPGITPINNLAIGLIRKNEHYLRVHRQRSKQWPKRNSVAATAGPPTYQPCVCDESMGFVDLGVGYWPRLLPSRQCGFNISPFTALCDAPDHETMFKCAERVYGVHVLRRREGRSEPTSRNMLPPELSQDWELVERNVTISCELQVDI